MISAKGPWNKAVVIVIATREAATAENEIAAARNPWVLLPCTTINPVGTRKVTPAVQRFILHPEVVAVPVALRGLPSFTNQFDRGLRFAAVLPQAKVDHLA